LSDADAVTVIVPLTAAPLIGDVIEVVGGVVSPVFETRHDAIPARTQRAETVDARSIRR
jgi:hypothetical protein